ncbi:alpha-amylase family glycosyl hydrolase [Stakelama marina]|uniref:Alpha amylase C-terminal domain-containing protein n=1 Tax=Stakelama marina TaxID=2826939 RepID=A0A8T4IG26_9SPHN|nr:alpha-amylase family glycosyl hydrolase [Stakelama marina]MBR0553948.1 alpha amylase C-terminal domain-containing protein [Stakelama marina]
MKTLALALAASILATPPAAAQTARKPLDQRTLADYQPKPYSTIHNAPWSETGVLYQINTRQFTPEGTFRAAQKQLPRLKKLGVDIIWLMPIHPIGEKNRKGELGSPYSAKDYRAVNPEFGTKADLKAFVDEAHRLGMHVILDWVANHTAWDNVWVKQHPDWYVHDWKGDFTPTPWLDWTDIIDLDYSKPGLRKAMTEAMVYWVKDFGIDGYRADVAGYVPLDFWEGVRADLEAIKPVFMLAEWKYPEFTRKAFDATYAWEWHDTMKKVAQGQVDATALYGYYSENESAWPKTAMRLDYVANHDSNAWEGTQYENFGDALPAVIALSFTGEGIPMIYNGQEACNDKRLEFFDKDPIAWQAHPDCKLDTLFHDLIAFRDANKALHNGKWGARMVKVDNDKPKQVFSWVRQEGSDKVFGAFNFSAEPVTVTFPTTLQAGQYREFRSDAQATFAAGSTMQLPAWGYRLFASD